MKKLLAVLAVGLLLGADDQKGDAKKDKLQGTWSAVTAEQNGKVQQEAGEHTLAFEGETFTIARKGETVLKGTFKADATKKPQTIDMEIKEGRREQDKGKTVLGIYELDGDTLKWCAGEPGSTERPTEFSAGAGSKRFLVTLKREKK